MHRATRKPRKALKTIKVSDAAEAFPRLHFFRSVIIASHLDQPLSFTEQQSISLK